MSKVTMLEPAAYVNAESFEKYTVHLTFTEKPSHKGVTFISLVSTAQAEAYKDACVREALDEAAKVCDTYFKEIEEQSRSTYQEGAMDAADILEQRIRALLPSTPA